MAEESGKFQQGDPPGSRGRKVSSESDATSAAGQPRAGASNPTTPPPAGDAASAGAAAASSSAASAGSAAAGSGQSLAKQAVVKAAEKAGPPGSSMGKAAGDAMDAAAALKQGDIGSAAEAGVRAGATAAADYIAPGAGKVVNKVLSTELGKKASRATPLLLLALAAMPIIAILMVIILIAGAISALFNAAEGTAKSQPIICYVNGVASTAQYIQLAALEDVVTEAAKKFPAHRDSAAAVAETAADAISHINPSWINPDTKTLAPPMRQRGMYGMESFLWAPEQWPPGTTVDSPAYLDSTYLKLGNTQVVDPATASQRFFAVLSTIVQSEIDALMQSNPDLTTAQATAQVWQQIDTYPDQYAVKVMESKGSTYPKADFVAAAAVAAANIDATLAYMTLSSSTTASPTPTPTPTTSTPGSILITPTPTPTGSLAPPPTGCNLTGTGGTSTLAYNLSGLLAGLGTTSTHITTGPNAPTYPNGYPKLSTALARANSYVGHAELACSNMCIQMCDHLAGVEWGYANSGYVDANSHWASALNTPGQAHPNSQTPALGSLLFYSTSGAYGHVAMYVGNGMVVTNYWSPTDNVYLIPADAIPKLFGARYLGWADPVFFKQPVGSGL